MKLPARYGVTFGGLGDKRYVYSVCTWLDERKAIVMATLAHVRKHPEELICRVSSVEKLIGTEPEETDIVDRIEW